MKQPIWGKILLGLMLVLLVIVPASAQSIEASVPRMSCKDISYPVNTAQKLIDAIDVSDSSACPGPDIIDLGGATVTLDSVLFDFGDIGATGTPSFFEDLTIQNGTIRRDPGAPDFRLFVPVNEHLTLRNVTLRGGDVTGNTGTDNPTYGAAIYSISSDVTLIDSVVEDNTAGFGGAIFMSDYYLDNTPGRLSIYNSIVRNNTVTLYGGAIYSRYGETLIYNSTFTNNNASTFGGVIYQDAGRTLITNSTFTDNASEYGGVIYASAATIDTVFTRPEVYVSDSSFNSNSASIRGGVIRTNSAELSLINVEMTGNESQDGGALRFGSTNETDYTHAVIVNTLFSGNYASGVGSAIYMEPYTDVTVTNSTFSGNRSDNGTNGATIYATGGTNESNGYSKLVMNNSIMWGNAEVEPIRLSEDVDVQTSINYSLIEGGNISQGDSFSNSIDALPLFVNALPANGAPFTGGDYRVYWNSPTVNTGDNTAELDFVAGTYQINEIDRDLNGDQRIVGGTINMGAYEVALQPPLNTNLLTNPTFNSNLNGWSFFGDISRTWSNGAVNIYRTGFATPSMFQVRNTQIPQGEVLEGKATLTNQSNVRKTVALVLRTPDFSQQMICSVTLNAGQTVNLTLQDVTNQDWTQIIFNLRTFDRDNLPAVRVDNLSLQWRTGVSITETTCFGNSPTVNTNYLLNGALNYSGWRYWTRFGSIIGDVSNGDLRFYRTNANPGSVFHYLYQYMPKNTPIRMTFDLQNASNTSKSLQVLFRDETWAQALTCTFILTPGQNSQVTMNITTNTTWGSSVVVLRPVEGDNIPALVVDNVNVRRVASGGGQDCNIASASSNLALNAISSPPYINGEVAQFTLNGATDDAVVAMDCDADGIFESDGLTCPVMSDTVTAQVSATDGTVLGTTTLDLDVMSVPETLAYLETEFGFTGLDAIDMSDPQEAFGTLFTMSQQTGDPMLASWLNRLAYTAAP